MYKHDDNSIDPRDRNLVTYNPQKKWFVTESSELQARGIEPVTTYDVCKRQNYFYIWMWSEKTGVYIQYQYDRPIMYNGEHVGDIFVPVFHSISSFAEGKAEELSKGTELHIIND